MTAKIDALDRRTISISRTLDAPPEKIWQALTDPEQMKNWYFDLPGFRAEVGHRFEFTGGPSPEKQYLHLCEITAVEPFKRLAYSWRFDGYAGDSLVEFSLFEKGGKTLVRITHSGLETFPTENGDFAAGNFQIGWTHILGKSLNNFLKSQPKLVIRRTFDAPRDLVFRTWTEPQHIVNWWGPVGMETKLLKFDLRPGGVCHYSIAAPEGNLMFGILAYREIAPPERLVFVSSFADAAGKIVRPPFAEDFPLEIFNVVTFAEKAGKTLVTMHGGPINAGEKELNFYRAMFTGMEKGFGASFDQLAEYLKT